MNNLVHRLPSALVVKSAPLLRKSLRKAASASALALTGTLLAAPAQAQWLTLDVAALTQAVTQYSAQTAEYAAQAERWSETLAQYQQQIAHYQQMIASVSGIDFSGMTISNNLARINNPSEFAAQACPGSGGPVDTALGAIGLSVPDLDGNIAQSQRQICQHISLLQVDNYNQTVDLLNQMNRYGELFQRIDYLRAALTGKPSSAGDLQASIYDAGNANTKLNGDVSNWRAKLEANNSAIATLKSHQSVLANIALKGKTSVIGEIIQAAAFAAAFN